MSKTNATKKQTMRRRAVKIDKTGELARVKIVAPAVRPKDVDLSSARKAAREYFRKHPKALERA
jgi:hypothetical protein